MKHRISTSKMAIGLACCLVLLGLSACGSNLFGPASTPTSTPQPVASVEELQFKDAETGRRFLALDRCIQDLVDDSWHTTSYHLSGNFYTASWCRGAGARNDCHVTYAIQDHRDQQAVELYTLFYDQDFPQVFGLGFHSLWVPQSAGWGSSYYFSERGGSVVGDGWGVTFHEYADAASPPSATVSLGWSTTYTIFGPNKTTFQVPSDLPLREDLASYLSGPEAMRDRGLAQIQALAHKVSVTIKAGQVNACDLGPYLGNGLPPACTLRPLTPDEEAAELARAESYFAEQEGLLRTYYQEMYAAWMLAFPLDQCWPN